MEGEILSTSKGFRANGSPLAARLIKKGPEHDTFRIESTLKRLDLQMLYLPFTAWTAAAVSRSLLDDKREA